MTFNEENTVEAMIRDLLAGPAPSRFGRRSDSPPRFGEGLGEGSVAETPQPYLTAGYSGRGLGWHFVPGVALPRQPQDVFVEEYVRQALIRLNPTIAARPERADEVLYRLRAIVLAGRSEGLIRANERFTGWLRGEMSMPFGPNHEHVTIRLIDFDDLTRNQYILATQYTFRAGAAERRADVVLLVNGFPLVLVEAKTPVRPSVSWLDGALQVHNDYERFVPELFVCNVFSVATEGKDLRYGGIGMPVELWGPWRNDPPPNRGREPASPLAGRALSVSKGGTEGGQGEGLTSVAQQIQSLLRPNIILDILAHFSLFATDKKKRRLKIVCRYQQYDGANKIVQRVLAGRARASSGTFKAPANRC